MSTHNKSVRMRTKIQPKQGIDLAPMVDVIFILVTYFLVNATLSREPVLDIVLPKSLFAQKEATQTLQVYIAKNHKIYLDQKEVPLKKLQQELEKIFPQQDQKKVVIKADRKITYEYLVIVMDKLYAAGIKNFKLATEY